MVQMDATTIQSVFRVMVVVGHGNNYGGGDNSSYPSIQCEQGMVTNFITAFSGNYSLLCGSFLYHAKP